MFFGGVTYSSASVSTNGHSIYESPDVAVQKNSESTPMFWADVGNAVYHFLVGNKRASDPAHQNVLAGKASIPYVDFDYEEIVESFDLH